jgi:hypothetical protein
LWNCATTPFIQLTSDGTDAPIRHTVSWAGAEEEEVVVPADEEPLELQPAIASAAAAPMVASAADVFLSPTAGTPSRVMNSVVTMMKSRTEKLTGNFPIR